MEAAGGRVRRGEVHERCGQRASRRLHGNGKWVRRVERGSEERLVGSEASGTGEEWDREDILESVFVPGEVQTG